MKRIEVHRIELKLTKEGRKEGRKEILTQRDMNELRNDR